MGRLDGKVSIITGCSAGIGKQMAIRFAEEGAKVAICARRGGKLLETAKLCEKAGGQALAVVADVSKPEDLDRFVQKTVERFGTIDILVNNAEGSLPGGATTQAPFIDTPMDYFDLFIQGGLYSTIRMMKLCFPYMKGKEDASVINFSSSTHLGGAALLGLHLSAYATSKAAITGLTRVVAAEWGQYGIRVNVIYPSVVTDTMEASPHYQFILPEMSKNLLKRPGCPEKDVVPVALFLASSDSRFMTGQALFVEGGVH